MAVVSRVRAATWAGVLGFFGLVRSPTIVPSDVILNVTGPEDPDSPETKTVLFNLAIFFASFFACGD